VVAPGKTARPSGDRVKTDRKDAELLARLVDGGPADGGLGAAGVSRPAVISRAREAVRHDLMRCRHRVSKGCCWCTDGSSRATPGSIATASGLRRQRFDQPPTEHAFADLVAAVDC
jgi:hypothetical protein